MNVEDWKKVLRDTVPVQLQAGYRVYWFSVKWKKRLAEIMKGCATDF